MVLKKRLFIAILVLGIYITCHTYLIAVMSQPYSGITASIDTQQNYIINAINKNGWAHDLAVAPGDIIKKVDGQVPDVEKPLVQLQTILYAEELTIESHDTGVHYQVAATQKHPNILLEMYIPVIFSLLTLLLSIFIYQKRSSTANYLIGFLMTASLSLFTSTESGHGDLGARLILTFSFPLGALFLVKFLYGIFEKKGIIEKRPTTFLKIDTVSGMVVIILRLLSLLFESISSSLTADLMLVYFCLNIVYSIGLLIYLYIKKRDSHYEPFLKWMLFILLVAFGPFIVFHAIPFILGMPYLKDEIAALFLFVIPLGYSYLIMTKQLLDINFILNRVRYYAFLSLLPTILVSLLVIGIINQENDSFSRFLQIFLLIFILNILFLFTKEKIDFSFRNQLFQDKTNLSQRIDPFTQRLSSIMKQDELETFLVNEIISTLDLSVIGLVDYDVATSTPVTKVVYGENDRFILHKQMKWMIQNDSEEGLLEYKGSLGIRLYKNDQKKTYIWIGHKKNQTTFNSNEKMWIITIVKYVRLVYENLHAISGLVASIEKQTLGNQPHSSSLSRLLFQLAEKERRRLASDLHDSALQDQIVWYRKLETLLNEDQHLSRETHEQLMKVKNGMVDVIKQIRNTCNELRPNLLSEVGLIKSLKELFSQIQMRVKYNLEYEFDEISETFDDYNQALSIYRVLQELLNNAEKHSEATHVSVNMWEENQTIYIDYRDNGKGLDLQSLDKKRNSMGLSGLKERISSINGNVDFLSKEGKGLQVHITLPRWKK